MTKHVLILNKKYDTNQLLIKDLLQIDWHVMLKGLALVMQWHKAIPLYTITELDTFFLKKDFREWSHAQKTQEVSEDPGVSRSVQLCIFMHFSGQLD